MKRSFDASQRESLFALAGGKCVGSDSRLGQLGQTLGQTLTRSHQTPSDVGSVDPVPDQPKHPTTTDTIRHRQN